MQEWRELLNNEHLVLYGYTLNDGRKVFHRLDGPTIKYRDGQEQYYIHDEQYTEQDFNNHPEVIAYRNEMKLRKKLGLKE